MFYRIFSVKPKISQSVPIIASFHLLLVELCWIVFKLNSKSYWKKMQWSSRHCKPLKLTFVCNLVFVSCSSNTVRLPVLLGEIRTVVHRIAQLDNKPQLLPPQFRLMETKSPGADHNSNVCVSPPFLSCFINWSTCDPPFPYKIMPYIEIISVKQWFPVLPLKIWLCKPFIKTCSFMLFTDRPFTFLCSQDMDSGARARSRIPQQPNRLSPTRMSLPPAALTRSSDREKAADDESRPGYIILIYVLWPKLWHCQ